MNPKAFQLVAISVMVIVGAAYMVFLVKSWEQMQIDRMTRDEKINELLDAVKGRKAPVVSEGC